MEVFLSYVLKALLIQRCAGVYAYLSLMQNSNYLYPRTLLLTKEENQELQLAVHNLDTENSQQMFLAKACFFRAR